MTPERGKCPRCGNRVIIRTGAGPTKGKLRAHGPDGSLCRRVLTDPEPRVYGHWYIVDVRTDVVVHEVESHTPEGSHSWSRIDDGLMRMVDPDRFVVQWRSAPA